MIFQILNLRSTDLQAFLGLNQLDKLSHIVEARVNNFKLYQELIDTTEWKINPPTNSHCSAFAYPIITSKIDSLVNELNSNGIECRPLICGSINKQPFWQKLYGPAVVPNADWLHEYGLYVPNNHEMTKDEIMYIANIVNSVCGTKN